MGKALCLLLALVALPRIATAEEITILAFGDSLTQGYGLPEDEGFVPRLEDWLEEAGRDVRVVNGGVSGDTTAGGAARIAWSLTPEVDAMIVALGGNDLLRGIAPEVSRANLDRILHEAQAREVPVLLVGLAAPGNYGPDYKVAFDAIYPELAEQYGALHAPSFFAGLPEEDPAKLRGYLQPDGIHPNADGVERIVEGLGPHVLDLIDRVK
ncbi:arylesterase [Roseovarius sp. SCSIO 43702]|uniref:arylesterase n=1 Tax=Roseovarius sp. SCSIO 43702 TaxID=2823043 RepID=UPI001C73AB81|nr:arylesterase [Roseovarius sp. SCSIO 43702]QYX57129.1 arylesterase [Roseovarius sp. SCSIO 43702]